MHCERDRMGALRTSRPLPSIRSAGMRGARSPHKIRAGPQLGTKKPCVSWRRAREWKKMFTPYPTRGRRAKNPTPINPVANKPSLPGSGTAATVVVAVLPRTNPENGTCPPKVECELRRSATGRCTTVSWPEIPGYLPGGRVAPSTLPRHPPRD